jgi:hypothetical protein
VKLGKLIGIISGLKIEIKLKREVAKMKIRIKCTIEIDAIYEVFGATANVAKEIIDKEKPLFNENDKENLKSVIADELSIEEKEISITNDSYKIIEK